MIWGIAGREFSLGFVFFLFVEFVTILALFLSLFILIWLIHLSGSLLIFYNFFVLFSKFKIIDYLF